MVRQLSFPKFFLLFAVVAFLSVCAFGLGHANMAMGSEGQMSSSNCFMPGMTALCQMNPLEHIAMWQSMFTAVPNQGDVLVLLLALIALVFGALVSYLQRSTAPPKIIIPRISFAYCKRHIPIANPLQEAFSNGILHPKVF